MHPYSEIELSRLHAKIAARVARDHAAQCGLDLPPLDASVEQLEAALKNTVAKRGSTFFHALESMRWSAFVQENQCGYLQTEFNAEQALRDAAEVVMTLGMFTQRTDAFVFVTQEIGRILRDEYGVSA